MVLGLVMKALGMKEIRLSPNTGRKRSIKTQVGILL